jgi:hypothetical protein
MKRNGRPRTILIIELRDGPPAAHPNRQAAQGGDTTYEQFKAAMSRLKAIAVDDWPGVDVSVPVLTENQTVGPA